MPNYKRLRQPGGTYFFTLALAERNNNDLLVRHIAILRRAISEIKAKHPFRTHAVVVLPEHVHLMITLPQGDSDFFTRIRLIKFSFTKLVNRSTGQAQSVWQKGYWEHLIRDQQDFDNHFNYIHFNPVKHGYVDKTKDWPHSTFHIYVERGVLDAEWGQKNEVEISGAEYD
ncbi:REP-associated tyrosine transposase [Ferrimonas lipolytica]|uniref:Transposase n=1 Tax=Ferrimonas lipolytica TaxID=2724191 RepID=A0A6H1UFC5_9GAMM|nr:transposase [Ferrimonas lipolytica]QIZ77329.1 transposase [Ferrimonas lipolytica]